MTEDQTSFDELLEDADLEDDVSDEDDEGDETGNLAVFPDDGPKSGTWIDADDVIAAPTEEEIEAGGKLGESIDVDDDEHTGVED